MERKVKNKFVCAKEVEPHVSEATIDCENEVVVGDLGAAEADQNEGDVEENEDDTWVRENEDDTNNLSSGPETAYLDSSDVGSYETDSDEDVVAKKDEPQFEICANKIAKLKGEAYNDLMTKDPRYWSKAFFSSRFKCDAVDNNFSEAFNSTILCARYKFIISMFEDIGHYVMHRIVEHKKVTKVEK
ncbi:hypothetical protein V6N13_130156 [Hibiscus sabdariffa]